MKNTMYKIDLLNGKAVPQKLTPARLAILAAPFLVAAIVLVIIAVWYMSLLVSQTTVKIKLADHQKRSRQLKDSVEEYRQITEKLSNANLCRYELSRAVTQNLKWTSILTTIAEKMPPTIILRDLNVSKRDIREQIDSRKKPDQKLDFLFAERTLKITVCGPADDQSDLAVRQYIKELSADQKFSDIMDDIRIVSFRDETFNDMNVTSYQIECAFKVNKFSRI
jgi:hypothetical protein